MPPETAWETPGACGAWSVKVVIAHLASYELVLVDILTTFTGGDSTLVLKSYVELGSQFNDIEVSRSNAVTIQDVLAEFNDTHIQVTSLLVKIPSEGFAKPEHSPGMVWSMPWTMSLFTCAMGINASTAPRSQRFAVSYHNLGYQ